MTLTTIKNDKRAILAGLLRKLASYVHVTCNGDLAILQSSGFPTQKPVRQPIGILPAPVNLTLNRGARSGDLDAKADPVAGARPEHRDQNVRGQHPGSWPFYWR